MKLRLPIVARLTLAFALSMAVLLATAGALLYARLDAELRSSIDSSLRAQADVLVSNVGQGATAFGDTTGPAIEQGQPFAQILSSTGRVVESSEPLQTPLLPRSVVRSLMGPVFVDRQVAGILGPCRLYAVAVRDRGQRLIVLVGLSLAGRERVLSSVLLLLGIGGLVTLSLASCGGWLLARAALRPVDQMRREADAVSGSDRTRRLPVPSTGDEVARLGSTLNSMLDRLEDAFQHERRFVDEASHELRTPVTILKTELELALSRSRSPTEIEAALRSALQETDRLAALAEDLLVYSRAQAGRAPVEREPVDIGCLVRDSCRLFAARADTAGVKLQIDAPSVVAAVDARRLTQALGNVIDNAVRRTPSGGTVKVTAASDDRDVRFVVEDTGPGFEPDVISVAFEPFIRGSAERATDAPGAGLGLAIVKAVVAAHGGKASIENCAEGGARVALVVPVDDPARQTLPGTFPAPGDLAFRLGGRS
jgi:signal transduction histidine kinase